MKATHDIPRDLLHNEALFRDPYFQRFRLRHAPRPPELEEGLAKDYLFPTLYADVRCAIGIFLCDYERARALLPHPAMRPVRMTRGRSLVTFSCYEYRNVLHVAPYNEIAMTVPVMMDARIHVPVLPMVVPAFDRLGFGFHVFHMPVTSRENQLRGNRIWGLPKVTEEIDIFEEGGDCVTIARDAGGDAYFTLRVPMDGTPERFDVQAHLYSMLGDRVLQSRTSFRGDFRMNKHMGLLFRRGTRPDRAYLSLGSSRMGDVLRGLEIEPMPFQLRYTPSMNAAFDLPNPGYAARNGAGPR
jgi:hypothetical protein